MRKPDYQGAIAFIVKRLEEELSPELTYHSHYHTQYDVIPATRRIAELIGLSERDIPLLEVAAAYHDAGFLIQYREHELAGVRVAQKYLPGFGFSEEAIRAISNMIMATRLPQSPKNLMEEILADADLDSLGREDFFERGNKLREERTLRGEQITDEAWLNEQIRFLRGHRYFTQAARTLRDEGKKKHLEILKKRLENLSKK
ncbi:MAG: hypothetical protein Fur0022_13840 [Anaerolineales bacterium]